MIEIDIAELVQLYLIALAVTTPTIAFRTWRHDRILTLNMLRLR